MAVGIPYSRPVEWDKIPTQRPQTTFKLSARLNK